MKLLHITVAVAPMCLTVPAFAETKPVIVDASVHLQTTIKNADTVTTGVAKGRDRLDSATSTSALRETEITKFAPLSIGELMRNIPGVRSEASTGEGNANISIRGLPIASSGAKFVQLQEDGLPVLEFGDVAFLGADMFLRADLNLRQVDAIRGGSASTFASNSPGGIINFISKTGETEGGAVAVTAGLDYGQYRTDFDYGIHINDSLRMHVGGFFRQGEGPRRTGYNAQRGGQFKMNLTKEFTGGYLRLYGKYLDDRTPYYEGVPIQITGTDRDPRYNAVPGFDPTHGTILSRNIQSLTLIDPDNNLRTDDLRQGQHARVKSIGVEGQFDLYGWTVTEKFRYASMRANVISPVNPSLFPAAVAAMIFGGPGATLAYANGAQAGTRIANPAALNGNGLLLVAATLEFDAPNLDNATNDIRASRSWIVGRGELTTTAGFYASRQMNYQDSLAVTQIRDVRGDGNAALTNVFTAGGQPVTQDGIASYDIFFVPGRFRRRQRVDYGVNAPFGSINYHIGKVAIGGSLRYDFGNANGSIFSSDLGGGRIGTTARDVNGDGMISLPESRVAITPLSSPAPVHYNYGYLSYSIGLNYRMADSLAMFGRYSRGARANADKILFTPAVSMIDGSLLNKNAVFDPVKQAEIGAKFRTSDLTLNLTGFWANVQDTNLDTTTGLLLSRKYRAVGAEFEGGYHRGIFGLTASATYTKAKIIADRLAPAIVGNTPRHQADVIFQATPQISSDRFSIGAVFIGTTGSYAQDVNLLRMPGYVTTNPFFQFRPVPRILLSIDAANVFDVKAFTSVDSPTIPAGGIVNARLLNGRTVSATARFDF